MDLTLTPRQRAAQWDRQGKRGKKRKRERERERERKRRRKRKRHNAHLGGSGCDLHEFGVPPCDKPGQSDKEDPTQARLFMAA